MSFLYPFFFLFLPFGASCILPVFFGLLFRCPFLLIYFLCDYLSKKKIVISWVFKLQRGPWKSHMCLCQILDLASSLGWFFSWSHSSINEIVDCLAKHGAQQMVSFAGGFLPPWVVHCCIFCTSSCFILVWYSHLSALVSFSSIVCFWWK